MRSKIGASEQSSIEDNSVCGEYSVRVVIR